MTILLPILTGLQPNSYAHAHGMRTIASLFEMEAQNAGHTVIRIPMDWQQDGTNKTPDGVCRVLLERINKTPHSRLIIMGHSFGAALLLFFTQWLQAHYLNEADIDLAIFFDLCPNPAHFGTDKGRWVPPEVAPRVEAFYQKNGRPMGICGWPIATREGVHNHDVSYLRDERYAPIGHTSLISHPDVITKALAAMRTVLDSSAPAGAPQPPAGKGGARE